MKNLKFQTKLTLNMYCNSRLGHKNWDDNHVLYSFLFFYLFLQVTRLKSLLILGCRVPLPDQFLKMTEFKTTLMLVQWPSDNRQRWPSPMVYLNPTKVICPVTPTVTDPSTKMEVTYTVGPRWPNMLENEKNNGKS